MPRVLIGNVKGGKGDPGGQGEQGEQGKQGIRGTRWTEGVNITGQLTEETVYATGIEDALPNDYYLNIKTGDIYRCIVGGDDNTATWAYVGNLKNTMGSIEDGLQSTSKTKALSANAGRVLNEKMNNAGLYGKRLNIDCTAIAYSMKLRIENVDSTIYITDKQGNVGTYEYKSSGENEEKEITIWFSSAIGLKNGAVVKHIESTNASIREYTLYDVQGNPIKSVIPSIWGCIFEVENQFQEETIVTEESEDKQANYKVFQFAHTEDGEKIAAFLVTHAKAIWWNKLENKTLYDKIMEDCLRSEQILTDVNKMAELEEKEAGKYIADARAIGMKLRELEDQIPITHYGTEEPSDDVGKDGDWYFMIEEEVE